MDFIERMFGISPDGGDGSFEWLLVIMAVLAVSSYAFRKQLNRVFFRTDRQRRTNPDH